MTIFIILLLVIIAALFLLVLSCCVLSSKISQEEERRELQFWRDFSCMEPPASGSGGYCEKADAQIHRN